MIPMMKIGSDRLLALMEIGPMSMPWLPPPGSPLRQAYLSHVAVEDDDPTLFGALLRAGLARAQRRGFAVALVGLATGHPFAAVAARHTVTRYRSLLHVVDWRRTAAAADTLPAQLPHPEIAVM